MCSSSCSALVIVVVIVVVVIDASSVGTSCFYLLFEVDIVHVVVVVFCHCC